MSKPLGAQSPFIGPLAPWKALDAVIFGPGANSQRLGGSAGEIAAGDPPPAAPGRPRLVHCTLDARDHSSPGWRVQKTEAYGYAEWCAVLDLDGTLGRAWRAQPKNPLAPLEDLAEETPVDEDQEFWDAQEAFAKAGARARRNMKWKIRMLKADRLWTLTKRDRIETRPMAWELWGQFERYCSRRFKGFKAVVVIEPHRVGGYHIHFVTNRFFDESSMRLWWHRILSGKKLSAPLRGPESPGNIDVSPPRRQSKLCGYMGKYLGKTFDVNVGHRFKRYAASKGIAEPQRTRVRIPYMVGGEVDYLLRAAEGEGYRVGGVFEGSICGRAFIWIQGLRKGDPP